MDTSNASAKKSIRASLTEKYEARVATTLEKVDPNRAKARAVLKEDELVVEDMDGEWGGYKEPLRQEKRSYLETPSLPSGS